ncbi:hypothetical protein ASPCAL14101 [Aspergillus calidoustus]|uniref:Phenylalanine-tRNA ligase class II N-terminal domain-containing protein n=1 Tax=Aspergillus calidoustus TaxID=454130 RepID=A0A0U5GF24_ASPCI|nr:hypothetical protein ASPCAL14101 [Aspergillus calidoustus]
MKPGRKNLNAQILSARRIVANLVAESDSPTCVQKPLRMQREIIDKGKTLGELVTRTAIAGELDRARRDHERQLRELETELRTQLTKADECHTAQLQDLKSEILQKVAKAKGEKKALRKVMSDLHDEERQAWMQKINELDKAFQAKIAEKEEELEDLKQSIHEIRQDTYTSSSSSGDEEEFYAHEEIVHNASQEIDDAKSNRDRLKRVAGNIVNGLANGVGAAVTTSVVGGELPF